MSALTGIPERTINRRIKSLTEMGIIARDGSARSGKAAHPEELTNDTSLPLHCLFCPIYCPACHVIYCVIYYVVYPAILTNNGKR